MGAASKRMGQLESQRCTLVSPAPCIPAAIFRESISAPGAAAGPSKPELPIPAQGRRSAATLSGAASAKYARIFPATSGPAAGATITATGGPASGATTTATSGPASDAATTGTGGPASGATTTATSGPASGAATTATGGPASGAATTATGGPASGAT